MQKRLVVKTKTIGAKTTALNLLEWKELIQSLFRKNIINTNYEELEVTEDADHFIEIVKSSSRSINYAYFKAFQLLAEKEKWKIIAIVD